MSRLERSEGRPQSWRGKAAGRATMRDLWARHSCDSEASRGDAGQRAQHPARDLPRHLGLHDAALEELLHLGDDRLEDGVIRLVDHAVEAGHDAGVDGGLLAGHVGVRRGLLLADMLHGAVLNQRETFVHKLKDKRKEF